MTPVATAPTTGGLLDELAGCARPRVRPDIPVMWRGESSIQIGDRVIVDRVGRAHVAWITSLDGMCPVDAIAESLTIPEPEAARLVRALRAAGALDDAARIPAPMRWLSQPEREVCASRHGAAVHTYLDPRVAEQATAARADCRLGVVGSGPLAERIIDAAHEAGLGRDDVHPTVIILAAEDAHPDAPAPLGLPAPERPHLPVAAYGGRAVAGPLVLPGRTSCMRCAHLHRRDADPSWPLLAVQWSQALRAMAVPPRDPALLRLAALHAVLLVREWLDRPHEPEHWADCAIEIELPSAASVRRNRPVHPLCGCQWLPATTADPRPREAS